MARHKTPEQIEANAAAASAKARAGGYQGPRDHAAAGRLALDGGQITYRGRRYPVKGARAEVGPDVRSGLAGRRHTTEITVTLASGAVLVSSRTGAGILARVIRREAVTFAAAVNTAAR